ncbi:MAG: hypothetical protein JOY94_20485, partial [Methylobacteriaceae bacterium]|nr:hypothetical protein [Methylobacteriaceae bacterium]
MTARATVRLLVRDLRLRLRRCWHLGLERGFPELLGLAGKRAVPGWALRRLRVFKSRHTVDVAYYRQSVIRRLRRVRVDERPIVAVATPPPPPSPPPAHCVAVDSTAVARFAPVSFLGSFDRLVFEERLVLACRNALLVLLRLDRLDRF